VLGKNLFSLDNPFNGKKTLTLDTIAVKQYLTYYQNLSWEVTAQSPRQDSITGSQPLAIIKVIDTKDKVTTIKLFHRLASSHQQEKYSIYYKYDPDRMFALVNDKDFVVVQYFVFGKILESASYFVR
jgi:hypothetical protein